jgi:hypothetical protein
VLDALNMKIEIAPIHDQFISVLRSANSTCLCSQSKGLKLRPFVFPFRILAIGNQEVTFGREPHMKYDSAWSELMLLAVLGILILAIVAQIALKYVR